MFRITTRHRCTDCNGSSLAEVYGWLVDVKMRWARFIVTATCLAFLSLPMAACRTGRAIDDAMITAQIKAELVADPRTVNSRINVVTQDGVVMLSGTVSLAARNGALAIAVGTLGVREVISVLHVEGLEG